MLHRYPALGKAQLPISCLDDALREMVLQNYLSLIFQLNKQLNSWI